MIVIIDNYDSFTYNIVQTIGGMGADVRVFRNDAVDVSFIEGLQPDRLLVSPGPCTPSKAGISIEAIRYFAGRIPILGNLFRSRKTDKVKTNLLVFIRPTILRDAAQTALETNSKYNYIRNIQQGNQGSGISLMPRTDRPVLPPLDERQQQDLGDNESDE